MPNWCGRSAPSVLAALLCATAVAAKTPLYFYDPDVNQEKLLDIISGYSAYFEKTGANVVFQPVSSFTAWEQILRKPDLKFAVVPSRLLDRAPPGAAFEPVLVAEQRGSVFYHKLLVDKGKGQAGDLRKKTIAAAVNDDDADSILKLLPTTAKVEGTLVVTVAKDIDAALAVVFDQADAAIVTPGTIELLKRVNPVAAAKLRTIGETPEILRAPLCQVSGRVSSADNRSLREALLAMDKEESGKKILQASGVDRWVPFSSAMIKGARR
jgi:ABC-type phosphate/phosphonate transport system substrate-binding protein